MDFARVRLRTAALWALGSLALAALLVNGCAAPGTSEQANFGVVQGRVVDTAGNPIAGAEVFVVARAAADNIGTQNFAGRQGPFVTDERGEFVIEGVRVTPSDPVVLNLQARRPGFVPGFAVASYDTALVVGGRTIPAGSRSSDIVVTGESTTDVNATLAPVGVARQIGPGGNVGDPLTFAVPDAANPSAAPGLGSVTFFPGSLSTTTSVSATALVSGTLPAPPPVTPAGVFTDTVAAPGKAVRVANLIAAVDLQPTGTQFGSNPTVWPEVELPLPLSRAFYGATAPVLFFNTDTGRWESQPAGAARETASGQLVVDGNAAVITGADGLPKAVFRVQHFSAWAVYFFASFNFGTLQERALSAANPLDVGILNAVDPTSDASNNDFPYFREVGDDGNIVHVKATAEGLVNRAFVQSLNWATPQFNFAPGNGLAALQAETADAATGAFAHLFLLDATNPANGPLEFVTREPQILARFQFPVTATLESGGQQATLTGQRILWTATPGTGPTIPVVPQHLQGHFQGGESSLTP